MAYDHELAARIREIAGRRTGVAERQMFGGIAFLLDGRMFCGVIGGDLMARVGPEGYEAALRRPHARPMDFTGRPMAGYVYVGPRGIATRAALARWVDACADFASALPPPRRRPRPAARPRPRGPRRSPG